MRSASTGTPAASTSSPRDGTLAAGFTLIEALVALALILAFAAALGPYLFNARRIIGNADSRVAAQALLRALADAPPDRSALAAGTREGESGGLRWRIDAEPMQLDALPVPDDTRLSDIGARSGRSRPNWITYRVAVSVSWAPGQVIRAETVRLGMPE